MILKIVFIFLVVVFAQSFYHVIKRFYDEKFWNKNEFKNFCYKVHGVDVWRSRSVAVTAFVFYKDGNDTFVLANKRGNGTPDYQGCWNVPCGYLDFNETGEEGAAREVFEETGVKVDAKAFKLVSTSTNPNVNKQNVGFRYAMFLPTDVAKNAKFSLKNMETDEVESVEWVNINSLSEKTWAFDHQHLIPNSLRTFNMFTSLNIQFDEINKDLEK